MVHGAWCTRCSCIVGSKDSYKNNQTEKEQITVHWVPIECYSDQDAFNTKPVRCLWRCWQIFPTVPVPQQPLQMQKRQYQGLADLHGKKNRQATCSEGWGISPASHSSIPACVFYSFSSDCIKWKLCNCLSTGPPTITFSVSMTQLHQSLTLDVHRIQPHTCRKITKIILGVNPRKWAEGKCPIALFLKCLCRSWHKNSITATISMVNSSHARGCTSFRASSWTNGTLLDVLSGTVFKAKV